MLYLLVLARSCGFVFVAPLLSSASLSIPIKGAFAILIALAVEPGVSRLGYLLPASDTGLLLSLLTEATAGAVTALILRAAWSALALAGEALATVSGFSSWSSDSSGSGSLEGLSGLFHIAAISVFISTRSLQRMFLEAFGASFAHFSPGRLAASGKPFSGFVLEAATSLFLGALALATPLFAALIVYWVMASLLPRIFGTGFSSPETYAPSMAFFALTLALLLPPMMDGFASWLGAGLRLAVSLGGGGS